MSKNMNELYPKAVWENFSKICAIPHPSKKEGKLAEYVKSFGEKLGFKTLVDECGNVIIKKPATPGMQNRKGVILQSHLDMVPQKNSDVDHDFEKNPIQPYIDDEWVKAKGTTLGADNGIGVAAAMAVLQSKELQHGPVEALFTIDEETGMTGAFNLKAGILNGDIMINLDSEDEGELYIGCAGGMDTLAKFTYKEQPVPQNSASYQLRITGLKGGHSGIDINLGRANSNKLLNRFLWHANNHFGLRIGSINGGSLRNAIPRESFAVVVIPKSNETAFCDSVKKFEAIFKKEYSSTEPTLKFEALSSPMPGTLMDETIQKNVIRSIYSCPNGAIGMIADMPEVVETSTNMAIVKLENGVVEISSLLRSSVDSLKEDLSYMVQNVFELAGAEVIHSGAYPGWKPNLNSPILVTMKKVYKDKFGKEPLVKVIHAGLECGIIGDVYPNLDLISFGPTIRHPHSPDEKVNIQTVGKFWDYLVETLKNIPVK